MRNASSKKTALDSQQYQVNLCRFMESLTANQVLTLKTKKMNNPFRKNELEQMLEFIKENPHVLNPIGAEGKITSSPLVQYILERLHGLN
jgi:hypothetical protein